MVLCVVVMRDIIKLVNEGNVFALFSDEKEKRNADIFIDLHLNCKM